MDSSDVNFSLVNGEILERLVTANTADLGGNAVRDTANISRAGFLGRIGTSEKMRAVGKEIKAALAKPGPLIDNPRSQLLMVPHHFSITKDTDSFGYTLSSVGIIVEYQVQEETFHTLDLLPNASFREVLAVGAKGEIRLGLSKILQAFTAAAGHPTPGITEDRNSGVSLLLDFGHTCYATQVSACGVGTSTVIFELHAGSKALVGDNLIVWTVVKLNKIAVKLNFRSKIFYVSKRFGFPMRFESEGWLPGTATL